MRAPTLALADVHRVTTEIGGRTVDIFIFDHHRTAFTLWCHAAAERRRPLTLVTLDRHMDLGTPAVMSPPHTSPLPELDQFARHQLATTNDDHIVAAVRAGAIDHAVVVARSHEPPSLDAFRPLVDEHGTHRFEFARTLTTAGKGVYDLIEAAADVVLDIDLDCFTTMSDGHPEEVLTWDEELIDAFVRPPEAEHFWKAVLPRVRLVTIAREPYHCGGFDRAAKLWLDFAEVFFRRLLEVPAP